MKEHKKMYKSGKKWVIATLLGVMTITAVATPSNISGFKNATYAHAADLTSDQAKVNEAYATTSTAYNNVNAYIDQINSNMSLLAKNSINDSYAEQYASNAINAVRNIFTSANYNEVSSWASEANSTTNSSVAANDASNAFEFAQSFSYVASAVSYDAYEVNKATTVALSEKSSNISSSATVSSSVANSTSATSTSSSHSTSASSSSANTTNASLDSYRAKASAAKSAVGSYYANATSYKAAIDSNMSNLAKKGLQNSYASSYASAATYAEKVFFENNNRNSVYVDSLASAVYNTSDLSVASSNADEAYRYAESLSDFSSMLDYDAYEVNKAIITMPVSAASSSNSSSSSVANSSSFSTSSSATTSTSSATTTSSSTATSSNASSSSATTNMTKHKHQSKAQAKKQAKKALNKAKKQLKKAKRAAKKAKWRVKKNEWRKHKAKEALKKAKKAYLKAQKELKKAKKELFSAEKHYHKLNK